MLFQVRFENAGCTNSKERAATAALDEGIRESMPLAVVFLGAIKDGPCLRAQGSLTTNSI